MTLRLDAVLFDHQRADGTTDALSIRVNASVDMPVPEWQRGVSALPAQSLAAYAIRPTLGRQLTVRAAFSSTGDDPATVEVRAISPLAEPAAPAWTWWSLYSGAAEQGLATTDVLGVVGPAVVQLGPVGSSRYATLPLSAPQLATTGVGAHLVVWRWQYRASAASPWVDVAISAHKVYTVLDVPTAPWQQTPDPTNTQLPWADVLDYACAWARGATDVGAAATMVTRAVNDLGPWLLAYDCPGGGITHYTVPILNYFNCTELLERLRGGLGNGYYLNCTDCASVVSTFANALGCDLWQSTMGAAGFPYFATNPFLAIGSSQWERACGWGAFDYHEVAWTGDCGVDDEVYDACLQVDAGSDPLRAPYFGAVPVGVRFGRPGEGLYRDRLAAPSGRVDCAPQPNTRQRRPVI